MILTVVPSGGKPRPRPRRTSKYEALAVLLYELLPAPTCEVIAARLSEKLGRVVPLWEVNALLAWVRRQRESLGWQPFYAKRGRNADGSDRFIVVQAVRDGVIHSAEDIAACRDGSASMLRAISTTSERFQAMLLWEAGRVPGRKVPAKIRALADDLGYVARKAANAAEQVAEENGQAQ